MTPDQDLLVSEARLREILAAVSDPRDVIARPFRHEIKLALTELLALRPKEAGQAVAWKWRARVKGSWGMWSVVDVDPNDWTWREYWEELQVEPLYRDPPPTSPAVTVDDLAQEIRRVDGDNTLGAGRLAEALMSFLTLTSPPGETAQVEAVETSGRSQQFLDGYRNAARSSVAWLYKQAASMNDPDPKVRHLLHSAAFQLGQSFKYGNIEPPPHLSASSLSAKEEV